MDIGSSRNRYRETNLLLEYKKLQQEYPPGVYCMPSFDDIFTWHGVIFIRGGHWKDGIFKFLLHIPENYPEGRPSVRFFSRVFHPQVAPSGEVDLTIPFPTWEPGKNMINNILTYIKRIFYYVDIVHPLNKEACDLFENDKKSFLQRVEDCVMASRNNRMMTPDTFSIKFHEHRQELDEVMKMVTKGALQRAKEHDTGGEGFYTRWFGDLLNRNNRGSIAPGYNPMPQQFPREAGQRSGRLK